MGKKKFSLHKATDNHLTQTIKLGDSERTKFTTMAVLTENVIPDPENPRCPILTVDDIRNGINKNDPYKQQKEVELSSVVNLSNSIKKEGLMSPIVVVPSDNNKFKIVAGFRRYLATILAGLDSIEVRLYKDAPGQLDVMITQWVENELRENLDLKKSVNHVKKIIDHYNLKNNKNLTAIDLSKMLSLSRQSAQYYKNIASNPVVMELIQTQKVKTMRIARELINCKSMNEALLAIEKLTQKSKEVKATNKKLESKPVKVNISLGSTTKPIVAKTIVEMVLSSSKYKPFKNEFKEINWSTTTGCKEAIKKLIALMEQQVEA